MVSKVCSTTGRPSRATVGSALLADKKKAGHGAKRVALLSVLAPNASFQLPLYGTEEQDVGGIAEIQHDSATLRSNAGEACDLRGVFKQPEALISAAKGRRALST